MKISPYVRSIFSSRLIGHTFIKNTLQLFTIENVIYDIIITFIENKLVKISNSKEYSNWKDPYQKTKFKA